MGKLPIFQWKLFKKLVFLFLILILPSYVLSLALNAWSANTVRREISASFESKSRFYLLSLESDISRVRAQLHENAVDEDFLKMGTIGASLTEYERLQCMNLIQKKLSVMKSISPYVQAVRVYFPSIDQTLSTNHKYDAIPAGVLERLKDPHLPASVIHGNQDQLWMGQTYPLTLNSGIQPVLYLEVVLSVKDITRTLSQIVDSGSGGAVLIGRNQDWHVGTPMDRFSDAWFSQQVWKESSLNEGEHRYSISRIASERLGISMVVFVPEDQLLKPIRVYHIAYWSLLVSSLIIIVIFTSRIYRIVHRPIVRLLSAFRKVEDGNLTIEVASPANDEFHYLYTQFNSMVGRLRSLIEENYEQKIRTQRSELKQLQSQISPHFLYNSFFMLKRLIKVRHYENALQFSDYLGEYFQFITRDGHELVSLEQEIQHARAFFEIQSMRFSRRIATRFTVEPDVIPDLRVPRILIQPLIENAFEHGLGNVEENGMMRVHIACAEDKVLVVVEDNGAGMADEELDRLKRLLERNEDSIETTGLLNVHRRLRLAFGADSGVTLHTSELGGLRVELRIQRTNRERPDA